MATWRHRFEELAAEMARQIDRWRVGVRNHNQVISAAENLSDFMRQWDGRHPRDQEMP